MTPQEIIEGNRIIAEWMGYKLITPEMRKTPSAWKYSYWENPELKGSSKGVLCSEKYLSYHSSWNWLMSCFNKLKEYQCSYKISEEYCEIKSWVGRFHVEYVCDNTIDAAYNCMINFIQWYNEHK